jgi:hypothetical protein
VLYCVMLFALCAVLCAVLFAVLQCCVLCVVLTFTSSSTECSLVRFVRPVIYPISFIDFFFLIIFHTFSSILIYSHSLPILTAGHAYAKALHYRELEFQTSPAVCFESLININKKLDQYDAAIGILKVVGQMQKKHPELVR